MQGKTATTRHGVTRKRNIQRLRHTENLFRKNLQVKEVKGKRKAFYRQRIPMFFGGSFSNRDNEIAPIQFRRESQPQHLKR